MSTPSKNNGKAFPVPASVPSIDTVLFELQATLNSLKDPYKDTYVASLLDSVSQVVARDIDKIKSQEDFEMPQDLSKEAKEYHNKK